MRAVAIPSRCRIGPADPDTSTTISEVRDTIPDNVYGFGITAVTDDLNTQLAKKLPLFIGAVIAVSFLLLMLVFRSIAVPLKAAAMNLLSIGGAYGVLVAVFQWGLGQQPPRPSRANPDHFDHRRHHVPGPVRALHGLRGVPAVADP